MWINSSWPYYGVQANTSFHEAYVQFSRALSNSQSWIVLSNISQHFLQTALISARVKSTKMLNLEGNGVQLQK